MYISIYILIKSTWTWTVFFLMGHHYFLSCCTRDILVLGFSFYADTELN